MSIVAQKGKVFGSIVLTLLWICCFIFIKPSLIFDFGGGLTMNFLFMMVLLGLLVIVLFQIFYPATAAGTKLSLTAALTLSWLSLIIFYPFRDPNNHYGGAVGFFALIGGLGVCMLWIYFFCDEVK